MKHLIIYAHPNPLSFCHAIQETVQQTLQSQGHEVVVRDLYQLSFNPVLSGSDFEAFSSGTTLPSDIQAEQDYIRWAEVITWIYPIWWAGMPAMLKGYIDRVFSYGFAYAPDGAGGYQKLLAGKKAIVLHTQGQEERYYEENGMKNSITQISDQGIFDFCGIEVLDHFFFGAVPFVDDSTRKAMLGTVEQVLHQHFAQELKK